MWGKRDRVRGICGSVLALAVASWVMQPAPARAFELFGVHLWGEKSVDPNDVVVDPVVYEPELTLPSKIAICRTIWRCLAADRQEDPAQPSGTVGLLQRARDDQANLVGRLYEKGYFGAVVRIEIAGRHIEDISVSDTFADGESDGSGRHQRRSRPGVQPSAPSQSAACPTTARGKPSRRPDWCRARRRLPSSSGKAAQELVIASERDGPPLREDREPGHHRRPRDEHG